MLHDQYPFTTPDMQPAPDGFDTVTVTVLPLIAPPETMPGVTNAPAPSRLGAPSTLTVTVEALVLPSASRVWVAVSVTVLPFGTPLAVQSQSVSLEEGTAQTCRVAPPFVAVTTTLLSASLVQLTAKELVPKKEPSLGAVMSGPVTAAGAGGAGGAGAADATPTPRPPIERSVAANTAHTTATRRTTTRQKALAPRLRNERVDAFECVACTVLPFS